MYLKICVVQTHKNFEFVGEVSFVVQFVPQKLVEKIHKYLTINKCIFSFQGKVSLLWSQHNATHTCIFLFADTGHTHTHTHAEEVAVKCVPCIYLL